MLKAGTFFHIFLVALLTLSVAACSSSGGSGGGGGVNNPANPDIPQAPDKPVTPDEPVDIPVESVEIEGLPEEVVHGGEPFALKAKVLPVEASNKEVEWQSSNTDCISVDGQGKVTIKAYTPDAVTVTAVSRQNRGIKDEWTFNMKKAGVTDVSVSPESVKLTLRQDGVPVSAKITAAVKPDIAEPYTEVSFSVVSGGNIIQVGDDGKVTALTDGSAQVTVTAESVTKTVDVTVLPAPDVTVPVQGITITNSRETVYKNGETIRIAFALTPPETTETNVKCTVRPTNEVFDTDIGQVEIRNIRNGYEITCKTKNGHEDRYEVKAVNPITQLAFTNPEVKVKQDEKIRNPLQNENDVKGSSSRITYTSLDPDIAIIDPAAGEVTGKKNGIATMQVTVEPKYDSEPLTAQFTVDVLGRIDYSDDASLEGTYDIIFFGTNSNGSGVTQAILQTDCTIYKSLWNAADCKSKGSLIAGAGDYEIPADDFAGRAVIKKTETGALKVHTKVAFKAGGHAESAAPDDQYQYTMYHASLNQWLDKSYYGGAMPGRNLSKRTNPLNPKYYFEQEKTFGGKTDMDAVLFSHFEYKQIQETSLLVNPDTRLVLRKISSRVIPMNPNSIAEEPFNRLAGKISVVDSYNANIEAPLD